jgi:hypothetical protein
MPCSKSEAAARLMRAWFSRACDDDLFTLQCNLGDYLRPEIINAVATGDLLREFSETKRLEAIAALKRVASVEAARERTIAMSWMAEPIGRRQ